ncbi:hypothetical protein HII31_09001 [Pseudocercospora fuligena]|uniref:Zn(2)-C6 fungal-type domain-containing protein n=1 Tax=Pseudocercospora fuligena TaxID=685502 RepID=A0A8H6RGK7_9PEZI|nr:hypothetical protein HII31_09001 [Pseudocercospora fuligena]
MLCNGKQPCTRCAARRDICVYSRATRRDVPVTPAQVALLQHQKERLSKALQQMASVIAKHETGQDKTPASFDVPDLLDKYAPTNATKREHHSVLDQATRATKRNRVHTLQELSSLDLPGPSHAQAATYAGGDGNRLIKNSLGDTQFVLEPVPGMQQNALGNDAFESMLQFMQIMGTSGTTSGLGQDLSDSGQLQGQNREGVEAGSAAALPPSFVDLVDWEASLANFPDSILNFGSTLPPENNDSANLEDNSAGERTVNNGDGTARLP